MEDWIGKLLHFPQFIFTVSFKNREKSADEYKFHQTLWRLYSPSFSLLHDTWLWWAILGLCLGSHF